jgi:hypothetical protein
MNTNPLFLFVPLVLVSSGVAQAAPQQSPPAHVWHQSEERNTADAFSYWRFTLMGKFLTSSHDEGASRPAVVVDCIPAAESPREKATFLSGNLVVGKTLKVVYVEPEEIRGMSYFPKVAVRYRTDDAKKEMDEQWSPRSANTSASIPKQALKELLRAHTVAITALDDRGRPLSMQFEIPDPTLVEQSCDVD